MQIALGKLRRDLPQHPFLLRSLPAAPFLPFLPFLLSVVFFIASIILPPQAIEVSILLCFYASMLQRGAYICNDNTTSWLVHFWPMIAFSVLHFLSRITMFARISRVDGFY